MPPFGPYCFILLCHLRHGELLAGWALNEWDWSWIGLYFWKKKACVSAMIVVNRLLLWIATCHFIFVKFLPWNALLTIFVWCIESLCFLQFDLFKFLCYQWLHRRSVVQKHRRWTFSVLILIKTHITKRHKPCRQRKLADGQFHQRWVITLGRLNVLVVFDQQRNLLGTRDVRKVRLK